MKNLRRHQREERSDQHHQCDGHIKKGHHRKDQKRRQDRDDQLRQILPEIDLKLLDAFDHCHNGVPGALKPKMRRTQLRDLIENHPTQMHLYYRRGIVRHHRSQVFKPATNHHNSGHAYKWQGQLVKGRPGKNPGDQPAQQSQAGDTKQHGRNANRHRAEYAQPHTLGKTPEP